VDWGSGIGLLCNKLEEWGWEVHMAGEGRELIASWLDRRAIGTATASEGYDTDDRMNKIIH
jgi:hypothetical protein